MKIITKSNFGEEMYVEKVVAENVSKVYGQELVSAWIDKHWNGLSYEYLELVEDDYVLYDGYKELIG